MKIKRKKKDRQHPVPELLHYDHTKDNQVSEYTDSLKVLRNYTVTLRDATKHHVVANRFIREPDSSRYTFEGDVHSGYAHVAAFENVTSVTDDASVDNTVAESNLRTFTVVDKHGKTHTVEAAKMSFYGGAVNFFGAADKSGMGKFLCTFSEPIAATPATVCEPPRDGSQYYSVGEVKAGLSETYGGGSETNSDYMFGKVRVQLKPRKDQRYTLAEWRDAALNSDHYSSGSWYEKQIEKAVTQVRKNRAFSRHGDS